MKLLPSILPYFSMDVVHWSLLFLTHIGSFARFAICRIAETFPEVTFKEIFRFWFCSDDWAYQDKPNHTKICKSTKLFMLNNCTMVTFWLEHFWKFSFSTWSFPVWIMDTGEIEFPESGQKWTQQGPIDHPKSVLKIWILGNFSDVAKMGSMSHCAW